MPSVTLEKHLRRAEGSRFYFLRMDLLLHAGCFGCAQHDVLLLSAYSPTVMLRYSHRNLIAVSRAGPPAAGAAAWPDARRLAAPHPGPRVDGEGRGRAPARRQPAHALDAARRPLRRSARRYQLRRHRGLPQPAECRLGAGRPTPQPGGADGAAGAVGRRVHSLSGHAGPVGAGRLCRGLGRRNRVAELVSHGPRLHREVAPPAANPRGRGPDRRH